MDTFSNPSSSSRANACDSPTSPPPPPPASLSVSIVRSDRLQNTVSVSNIKMYAVGSSFQQPVCVGAMLERLHAEKSESLFCVSTTETSQNYRQSVRLPISISLQPVSHNTVYRVCVRRCFTVIDPVIAGKKRRGRAMSCCDAYRASYRSDKGVNPDTGRPGPSCV